jgi:hypothetical protein
LQNLQRLFVLPIISASAQLLHVGEYGIGQKKNDDHRAGNVNAVTNGGAVDLQFFPKHQIPKQASATPKQKLKKPASSQVPTSSPTPNAISAQPQS